MTRCAHTGLSIPECSCRACLLELVRNHAPSSPQVPQPEGSDDDQGRDASQE